MANSDGPAIVTIEATTRYRRRIAIPPPAVAALLKGFGTNGAKPPTLRNAETEFSCWSANWPSGVDEGAEVADEVAEGAGLVEDAVGVGAAPGLHRGRVEGGEQDDGGAGGGPAQRR